MVTVEVDPVRVESRLAAGGIACPTCGDGVLGGWGYARVRRIDGVGDPMRPRRARCRACAVTHVLLPVTVLVRRAYAAERIWAVLHRPRRGVGASPDRRESGGAGGDGAGLAAPRSRAAGGDPVVVSAGGGDRWGGCADPGRVRVPLAGCAGRRSGRDARRSGSASVWLGLLGAVTPDRVAVAASSGRLLAPGWPELLNRGDSNTNRP